MSANYLKSKMAPCKHCGGEGEAWRTKDSTGTHYHVRCSNYFCIAYELYHRRFTSLEGAIAAWNKSAPKKGGAE